MALKRSGIDPVGRSFGAPHRHVQQAIVAMAIGRVAPTVADKSPDSVGQVVDAPHIDILRTGLVHARRRRDDLAGDLAGIAESTAGVPDDEHDPEGSTVGFERARVTSLLHQAEREIEDLGAALKRATGNEPTGSGAAYGECQQCGSRIGADRLMALPAARTCMACAVGKYARQRFGLPG